jgi:hypothetical protein
MGQQTAAAMQPKRLTLLEWWLHLHCPLLQFARLQPRACKSFRPSLPASALFGVKDLAGFSLVR